MDREYTILIADRNRHVREFLRREMTAEGYRVRLANTCEEVLKWVFDQKPLDLLILDPDLPDASGLALLDKIEDRIPTLPVVIHTLLSDYSSDSATSNITAFVEKKGNSIKRLKEVVFEVLQKLNQQAP